MAYNSGIDLSAMMTKMVAETIYAAQESSIFLGGAIIPVAQGAPGSTVIRVPKLTMGDNAGTPFTAQAMSGDSVTADFAANALDASGANIQADLYASRTVLRDFGGVDASEVGRVLGNAVTAKFDASCTALFPGFTATQTGVLSIDGLLDAAAQIRGAGETGTLYGVVSPAAGAELMKDIGTSSFAGSDQGSAALTNGWLGTIAGVNIYQSAHVSTGRGAIFGADALRIGMFANVDVEAQRRAAAVGFDIVASLTAGVAMIDDARGVELN